MICESFLMVIKASLFSIIYASNVTLTIKLIQYSLVSSSDDNTILEFFGVLKEGCCHDLITVKSLTMSSK